MMTNAHAAIWIRKVNSSQISSFTCETNVQTELELTTTLMQMWKILFIGDNT